jgi:lambda family phage portal protein
MPRPVIPPLGLIERMLMPIAPRLVLARSRARVAAGMLRGYDGASKTRRTAGWKSARPAGPVTEVRAARATLRDRSRDLARNNSLGKRAIDLTVAHQIGTGIRPRPNSGSKALDRKIMALWDAWGAECDAAGQLDIYGLQALAARTRAESGEVLVLQSAGEAAGIPLRLQLLEPDWLYDDVLQRAGAASLPAGVADLAEGIEFDAAGRRVAYRLWERNPNEDGAFGSLRHGFRRVPAADLIHLYRIDRPGQLRGVPDIASAIMRMRDLDDYHDAALMLAKVQSVLGVFITQAGGPAGGPVGQESADPDGERLDMLSSGMIGYLQPGEDVKFLTPDGDGPFTAYTRTFLHLIALAFGLTYHQLTGDLSEANYSSLRAGSLDFRRLTEQAQWLMLIPRLCQPIWRAFLAAAVLAGKLPAAAQDCPVKWTPPRFDLVDPGRDTAATVAQIRAGLVTLPEAIAEMGYDPAEQIEEIAQSNARLDDAKVVLDSDPRRITATGTPNDAKQLAAIELGKPAPAA